MKAKELIEILQKMDPDTMVCVDGYEGGVSDIWPESVRQSRIRLHQNYSWVFGRHDECDDGEEKCVIIGRCGASDKRYGNEVLES